MALSPLAGRGRRRAGRALALTTPKPKEGRRLRQPSGVAIRSLAHPGDGRAAVAACSVPLPARDCGTLRSSGRDASAGRSPGRGRFRRTAFPPRCPCDPLAPCGAPASRSGHRSTRSPKGRFIRSPRVGSFARRLWFRRGCGCLFLALPEGAAAPLQPAPPGPKTGFASMAFSPARCPKASAPALPPVTPDTRPGGAIGRLSVPFTPGRCEHRPCGLPGWRPRPDPCGFPKAPAWVRP